MQHARLHLGDAEITLRASAYSSSCALRSTVTLRTIPSEPHGYTALDVILFGMLRILLFIHLENSMVPPPLNLSVPSMRL